MSALGDVLQSETSDIHGDTKRATNNNTNGISAGTKMREDSCVVSCRSSSNDTSSTSSEACGSPPSILHPGKSKHRKKVSFASLPENRRFSNADDCMQLLKEGCELIKTKKTGKVYRRYYYMDESCMEIKWLPTQKKLNKNKIWVSQIKEVLKGEFDQDADGELLEECAFTLVHGPHYETLSLVAKTAEIANVWVTGLRHLLQVNTYKGWRRNSYCITCNQSQAASGTTEVCDLPSSDVWLGEQLNDSAPGLRCSWLSNAFQKALGEDEKGKLEEGDLVDLVRRLNPTVSHSLMELKIKEINTKKEFCEKGFFDASEFISLFKDVSSRQEVYFLMSKYSMGLSDVMNAEGLQEFLMMEQCQEDVSISQCLQLIQEFEPSVQGRELGLLGIDGFQNFLLSKAHCDIFDSAHRVVCQDMTQPLNHYYIYSSHKSYLSKDQLKGPSCTTNYGHYLRKGYRYVEVDVWDGTEGTPIVYHGNTFTTKLDAADVLREIAESAFVSSEYPVMISLSNHCDLVQQEILARLIEEHLGEWLYTEPLEGDSLPSPETLKRKILLKGQKASPMLMVSRKESIEDPIGTMVQLVATHLSDSIAGYVSEDSDDLEPSAHRRKSEAGPPRHHPIFKAMASHICIDTCVFEGDTDNLMQPGSVIPPIGSWELWSMSETVAVNTIKWSSDQLIWNTKKSLMAVLPGSNRVDSSNYNPIDMWNHGVQIVAMNAQTPGQWMDLYRGLFQQNGGCGYVLKPAILRQPQSFFSLQSLKQCPGTSPSTLQIRVISGHQFPKPANSMSKGSALDPCVILRIFGVPADTTMTRTKTVPGNGLNPFFDEDFCFHTAYPDLALVRFAVLDDEAMGDEFIAQYTLPYRTLKPGYRYVNLVSKTGEPLPNCCLFVHIKVTDCTDKKPLKQGLSRLTVVKDTLNLREVHVKHWDDLFKVSASPMSSLIELKYGVRSAFARLVRACDLKDDAELRQCLRVISNRVAASPATTVKLVLKEKLPLIITEGVCPDMLRKAISAHQSWVNECSNLVENAKRQCSVLQGLADQVKVEKAELETVEGAEEFRNSPIPRKHAKVVEAVAYNLQVIEDQLSCTTELQSICAQQLQDVEHMFEPLGIGIIK